MEVDRKETISWVAEVLTATGDGGCAVDAAQRIMFWNAAAESLLGYAAGDVLGRRCYEVFGGRDASGNLLCCPHCPLLVMVQRGEPVASREMVVSARGGDARWINISTLVLPGRTGVVHLFRDVSEARARERLAAAVLAGRVRPPETASSPLVVLTRREQEVLQLLARGASTREIAQTLFISRLTARNHVQHILRKLGATSRAEAVAISLRGTPLNS